METQTKVLIVEDDAIIGLHLQHTLRTKHYDVTDVVSSGEHALRRVHEETPDLVLMDIHLGGDLDGIETAERIRRELDIPLVYLSAFSDVALLERAKATEPSAYLLKPIQQRELCITLEMAIYKHRMERRLKEKNQQLELEIEARKQTEEQLRNVNNLHQSIMRYSPAQISVFDRQGMYLAVNQSICDLYGLPEHEIVGKTFSQLLPPETTQIFQKRIEEIFHSKHAVQVEDELDFNHKKTYYSTTLFPLLHEDGSPYALCGIATDVTQRRKAELALQERETQYRLLFQQMTSGFALHEIILDEEGSPCNYRFLAVNPAFERLTGLRAEDLLHKTVLDVLPGTETIWIERYGEVALTGKAMLFEEFSAAIGKFYRIIAYSPQPGQFATIFTDITQQKQAEQALQHHREELERQVAERTANLRHTNQRLAREIAEREDTEQKLQHAKEEADSANQAKSEFLATVSHDIRTPMNAILGFTDILKTQLHDAPQYHSYLENIHAAGRNLLRLINDILDLSKIEAGHLDIQAEVVHLPALFQELSSTFSLKAREKQIHLEIVPSPDLPSELHIDGTRLRQILMNLLSNALKFTPAGDVRMECRLDSPQAHHSDEGIRRSSMLIQVRDSGIGIAPRDLKNIFEPFQQVQHTGRADEGSGLGLAITRKLVELMGGEIVVESELNQGSTFTLRLPFEEVSSPQKPFLDEPPFEQTCFQFEKASLLLVEDNPLNRELFRSYLEASPFTLFEAQNGQEALQLLPDIQPDLIFMDIQMPVMDGYKATQILKADRRFHTIPIVALTAYAMKDQQERYQDFFDAYLSKPASQSEVNRILADFLPHSESPPQKKSAGNHDSQATKSVACLQGLQVALEQRGDLSEEFREQVHDTLLPAHQALCEVISADKLFDFAERVLDFGKRAQLLPVQRYGEELLQHAKVFDIVQIKRLLAQFPEYLDVLTPGR